MYPQGRYGTGIRGLGTYLGEDVAGDLVNIDSNYTSFTPYLNMAFGSGVANTSVTPTQATNQSATAPRSQVGMNQWVSQNGNILILGALAILGFSLLKTSR